jgi:hypothetical protein
MSALNSTHPTMLDIKQALDPNGSVAQLINLLWQQNQILDDMVFMPCNDGTRHKTTVVTGIPEPTWRKMYGFVQPSKGQRRQIADSCGMLEAYGSVDKALADMYDDAGAFRLQEDSMHIEGMNNEVAATIFYGNEGTAPEEFTGLSPRFNSLSAENGENIIDCGGTGTDNNSIWLAVWGPQTGHMIYPKGSTGGLSVKDLQEQTETDSTGGKRQVYTTHYKWDVGMTIRDWRYFVRLANIDKSLLSAAYTTGADLCDKMMSAMPLIPNLSVGRAAWYMSRNTASFLGRQMLTKVAGSTLTTEMLDGRLIMKYSGIPIRICDALAGDEARVV